MKPSIDNLEQAAMAQQCRALRQPAVADLAERAEKANVIITTNPLSPKWTR